MSLIDAASFLAQQWPVFACGADKRPVTAHGFKDATTDPAQVRDMFRRPGAAMIGVPTGAASDLAVIDLDVKEGAAGLEWLAANEARIPPTRRHRTRSGGMHLLFRYPAGRTIRNSASKIAPGVDVRGEGGYIIAPPSAGYAIADDTMPAEMPRWLVDLLDPPTPAPAPRPVVAGEWRDTSAPGSRYGLAALQDEADAICGAPFGQQETTLNAAGLKIGALIAGGEIEAAYAREILVRAGLAMPSQPGMPAWAPEEVRRKIERAIADGQRNPRQAPARSHLVRRVTEEFMPPEAPPHDEPPPHWIAAPDMATDAAERPAPPMREAAPRKPAIWLDDDAWDEAQIERRPWIAPGYILRGAVTVLSGPGGGGKSNLSVGWSTALATGRSMGRFAGVNAEHGAIYRQIVYNVEDDRDEQRRRYSAALRVHGLASAAIKGQVVRCGPTDVGTLIHHDQQTGRFTLTDAWTALDDLASLMKPDVVWFDPLVELHTAEENDNTALRHVIARLRTFAKMHDCAVVLVHHARKGAAAGDAEGIRGAGSITGAARIALTVIPMTEEEAEAMQVAPDMRDLYFRVDGAKANYARRGLANWHTLDEYQLDNGDMVAAVVAWTPGTGSNAAKPPASPDVLALIEKAVERGSAEGPYSPRLDAAQPRSLASLLVRQGIEGAAQQKAVLAHLVRQGFVVAEYRDHNRIRRSGLRAPSGMPAASWLSEGRTE
jgi:hypothetical protein